MCTLNKNLTAQAEDGQQWMAAPACTTSIEPLKKGSLDISALTKANLLKSAVI
jgi:hypothetical protein